MSEEDTPKPSYADLVRQNAELEERIFEAQRVTNKGDVSLSLLAGMCHDMRNPLVVVQGYVDLCLAELDESSPLREYLQVIGEAAQRVNKMTMHVLSGVRDDPRDRREVCSITDVIDNSIKIVEPNYEKWNIHRDYATDLYQVDINKQRMSEVMLNMAINGIQAMPEGGDLTIRVRNYDGAVAELADGKYSLIEIEDNGVGIPEDMVEKIFEPFYSSRLDMGTGLGLTICKRIVEDHKGCITVDSEVDKGSTFRIYLPAHTE